MKTIFALIIVAIVALFASPAFAQRGGGHSGIAVGHGFGGRLAGPVHAGPPVSIHGPFAARGPHYGYPRVSIGFGVWAGSPYYYPRAYYYGAPYYGYAYNPYPYYPYQYYSYPYYSAYSYPYVGYRYPHVYAHGPRFWR